MKRVLRIPSLVFAISTIAVCSPCSSGTLADYISLGATGCTIGGNTVFDFLTVPGIQGGTQVNTASVVISPAGGTFNPGVTAGLDVSASAGNLLEAIFTYKISGQIYGGDTISLSGSSETGDGAVTETQSYCAGGSFGPDGVTGCTGTTGALTAVDGVQNSDSAAFAPVSFLNVTDDFVVDGGVSGSAAAGTITDQFTAVPEPSPMWFLGIAVAIAAGYKR
jgi:hypothetical protein